MSLLRTGVLLLCLLPLADPGPATAGTQGRERPTGAPVKFCGQLVPRDATLVTCTDPKAELGPLARLTRLVELRIVTRARDLSVLSKLHALKVLDLNAHGITTIDPLAPLTNLRKLRIDGYVQTVERRGGIPTVDAGKMIQPAVDLTALARLPHLQVLFIRHATLSDLRVIGAACSLRRLDLGFNVVLRDGDPGPLSGLTQLTYLDLHGIPLTTLEPLAAITPLEELRLSEVRARSLSPLAGLSKLRILALRNSRVDRVHALRQLTALRRLDLYDTRLGSYEPLRGLQGLVQLDLSYSSIRALSALAGMRQLRVLGLGHTPVRSLAPLSRLRALEQLDITATRITSLRPLRQLPGLRRLDLGQLHRVPRAQVAALQKARPELVVTSTMGVFLEARRDRFRE